MPVKPTVLQDRYRNRGTAIVSGARHVTDSMLLAAAEDGVATRTHQNLIQAVQDAMWRPVYPPSDRKDRP